VFSVKAGEKKDYKPEGKKNREWPEMLREKLPTRDFQITQCKRHPEGDDKNHRISQQEQNVLPLWDQRHIM